MSEVRRKLRRVFVVEDDPGVRGVLERALAGSYVLRTFGSGRDALNALQVSCPDVLLTDLEIPDVVGESLARAARHIQPIPWIVLMSGDPRRLAAAAHLADATVVKPFDLASLKATIEPPDPRPV